MFCSKCGENIGWLIFLTLLLPCSAFAENWILVAEWNEKTLGKDTLYQRHVDTDSITQTDNLISSRFYVSSTYAGGGHIARISVDCKNGFFNNESFGVSYKRKINFYG